MMRVPAIGVYMGIILSAISACANSPGDTIVAPTPTAAKENCPPGVCVGSWVGCVAKDCDK